MDLQKYLDENEISQEEFARRVGTTQPSLWRYINGERTIPSDVALAVERETHGKVKVEDLTDAAKRLPPKAKK